MVLPFFKRIRPPAGRRSFAVTIWLYTEVGDSIRLDVQAPLRQLVELSPAEVLIREGGGQELEVSVASAVDDLKITKVRMASGSRFIESVRSKSPRSATVLFSERSNLIASEVYESLVVEGVFEGKPVSFECPILLRPGRGIRVSPALPEFVYENRVYSERVVIASHEPLDAELLCFRLVNERFSVDLDFEALRETGSIMVLRLFSDESLVKESVGHFKWHLEVLYDNNLLLRRNCLLVP